jgi:microcystin-dependent protein
MKGISTKKVATFVDVNNELDNIRQLLQSIPDNTVSSGGVPSGAVFAYTAPTGYLICNGATYSSSQYPALFSIIGNSTWGNSPTSSTFKVPDLRAASIRGAGTSTVFTSNATVALGQIINDQMQGHYHDWWVKYTTHTITSGPSRVDDVTNNPDTDLDDTRIQKPVTDGTNGTPRVGLETTGKAIGMNFIIKI